MEYEVTPQRQAYLDARGYTILTACPGSGKTTSIVKKLYAVSQYCSDLYGKHAGFACLSFTNKACDELKDKYHEMHGENLGFPNVVSTIDSFVMQYIVLPFWYLCKVCGARPIVINEENTLNDIYMFHYTDGEEAKKALVKCMKPYKDVFFSKSPHDLNWDIGSYKWKNHVLSDQDEINYCKVAVAYRLTKGVITSTDATWIACNILENHYDVAVALAKRFPYIIVDEAQDNSALQFHLFSLLKAAGLENLEFVGDLCQAIYEFRNARPDILQGMMDTGEWNSLPLSECRRSNQRIINLYSKLKLRTLPAITSHGVDDLGVPIMVFLYDKDNARDIIRSFHEICDVHDLKSRMILARGVPMCKDLAGVKDKEFRYWKTEIPYLLIDAKLCFEDGCLHDAFRKVRIALSELMYSHNYDDRRKYIQAIEKDVEMNSLIFRFLMEFPSLSLSFTDWTDRITEQIQVFWNLPEKPIFEAYSRKKDKNGRKIAEIANLPVEQYHQTNAKGSEFHKSVDTIHSAKGATMDAVLLFLSDNSKGTKVSLNDFLNAPVDKMTESQRMIYVACSRAAQFLALALPNTVKEEEIAIALQGVDYELKKVGLQTEIVFTD